MGWSHQMGISLDEWKRRQAIEVKKHHEALRLRYDKAFAKDKVNWLRLDFDPVTEKYCDEKAEQKYLTNFGGGLWQEWRPNSHHFHDNHNDPRLKKIIEQEKKLRQECGVFGTFTRVKVNRVTTGHKDKPINKPKRNSNPNPIKRIEYRD